MKQFRQRYLGDRAFYGKVLTIAIPIIIQNFITNFVGMLDNIMVGRMGTDQMNGVAIVNQLMFVFFLCVWGAVSGAGIFSAQYYGKGDHEGVRDTFRGKIVLVSIVLLIGCGIFLVFGDILVSQFLHKTDGVGNAEATLAYAHSYLRIMLIGLVPFVIGNAYSNTLRDIGQTMLPMKAGIIAVFVNLILNYVLIFGHFGMPGLGSDGAAIATVVSRFVETGIMIVWTHTHKEQAKFIVGAYRTLRIPLSLVKQIIIKGTPLAVNEALWSIGMTVLNQNYSLRGLAVVGAFNISTTITNLFGVVYIAMGDAVAIIVGQLLGAKKMDEAKDTDRKIIFFSFSLCVVIAAILASTSSLFPAIYNTEQQVKDLAAMLIRISALFMPMWALMHCCYFTLRTGGVTFVTFLFDSFFMWVVEIPVVFLLAHFTAIPAQMLYLSVQMTELIKVVIGIALVKKGIWVKNIVGN